jgi:small subunit ribosomal protein S15
MGKFYHSNTSHNISERSAVALAQIESLCYHTAMLTKRKKTAVMKETGIHDKDTGSPEVQIALLSKRIEELTSHLKKHTSDKHSRRGLLQMVADRRTHLKYLEGNNKKRYNAIVKKLNLKK